MNFSERFRLLARLHSLILRKATGSPNALAEKLGVSRTALYDYIHILEGFGAEVKYCRTRESFFYIEDFQFSF